MVCRACFTNRPRKSNTFTELHSVFSTVMWRNLYEKTFLPFPLRISPFDDTEENVYTMYIS